MPPESELTPSGGVSWDRHWQRELNGRDTPMATPRLGRRRQAVHSRKFPEKPLTGAAAVPFRLNRPTLPPVETAAFLALPGEP